MILTGEQVDADTAQRIGLVEEVVEKGAAVEVALQMASRVTKLSPQIVAASKSLIHLARQGVPRHAALALERERFVELLEHQNRREGANAFLQKREPQWSADWFPQPTISKPPTTRVSEADAKKPARSGLWDNMKSER